MNIQGRLLKFVTIANWVVFLFATIAGFLMSPPDFAWGIVSGGLIVTINFHMLHKTLKKALTPPYIANHNIILAKYYVRFIISGLIIFFLISSHFVSPIGLLAGLSVVIVSITLATMVEFRNLFLKEAM